MESGNISTAEGFRTAYAEIFSDVGALAEALDDERAMLATGCPGWTVRDHVAHVTDLESILVGRTRADHVVPDGAPSAAERSANIALADHRDPHDRQQPV